jgi:hypothetical protein
MKRQSSASASFRAPPSPLAMPLLLVAALTLSACNSAPTGMDPENGGQDGVFGTLTARINGELFEVSYAYSAPGAGRRHVVGGNSPAGPGTGPFIGLMLVPFAGPGTYTIGDDTNHLAAGRFTGLVNFDTDFEGSTGTIVVTEERPRLKGTFSFTARGMSSSNPLAGNVEEVLVTDGRFDVPRVD